MVEGRIEGEILPLTGLRFVAAFYVFLFHIHIRWPLSDHPAIDALLSQGAIGMTLFFMLSGYVLAHRYGGGLFNLRGYYLSRFARIYPVYLTAAIVTLPWLLSQNGQPIEEPGIRALTIGATLIGADLLMIQAWFPQMFPYWNNGGSWSLSVEAFFYATLPAWLLLFRHFSARYLLAALVVAYALAILPGFVYLVFENRPTHGLQIFYAMPIFRLPEFVAGICVCLLAKRTSQRGFDWALIGSAFVLGVYIVAAGRVLPIYVTHNWLVVPVVGLALFALPESRGFIARFLSSSPMVWAGRVSYCFYSFQALLLLTLISHHDSLVTMLPFLQDNLVLAISAFVILLGISGLAYHWIEEPMRVGLRRFAAQPA